MGKNRRMSAGRKGDGLAPFLANMQKYRDLINSGYTARTVHEQHVGELKQLSYRQFLRYVRKYIRDESPNAETEPKRRPQQKEDVPAQVEPSERQTKTRSPPFEIKKLDPNDI